MSIQPLEIVFECHVCASSYTKLPTKYKCSNCEKKIWSTLKKMKIVMKMQNHITKKSSIFKVKFSKKTQNLYLDLHELL